MKRETYLKLKIQKRKAKLLGILTALSLFNYALKYNKVNAQTYDKTDTKEQILELILEKAIYNDTYEKSSNNDYIVQTTPSYKYSNNFTYSIKDNTDIAHRGIRFGNIRENSKEAFILAGQNGFWGCEADVRFDNNGNLVCSHNTVTKGQNPPTFEEYLDICKEYGMTAIIDLKYIKGPNNPDYELSTSILKTIKNKNMMNSCILQTNNPIDIEYIREISIDARIWYLTDEITDKNIEFIKQNNVECVNILSSENNFNRINKLKNNGINICIWNVQTKKTKESLLNFGATYIMSDNVLNHYSENINKTIEINNNIPTIEPNILSSEEIDNILKK